MYSVLVDLWYYEKEKFDEENDSHCGPCFSCNCCSSARRSARYCAISIRASRNSTSAHSSLSRSAAFSFREHCIKSICEEYSTLVQYSKVQYVYTVVQYSTSISIVRYKCESRVLFVTLYALQSTVCSVCISVISIYTISSENVNIIMTEQ